MKIVNGKHNTAKVYTNLVDDTTLEQIESFCNLEYLKDETIRIMPDTHFGKGVCIGFTSTYTNKVDPKMVGVDISCGVVCYDLGNINIDFEKLDKVIREKVPFGKTVNNKCILSKAEEEEYTDKLRSMKAKNIQVERNILAIGSLGGGNHFIEINENDHGKKYLVIHTGSRHLGVEIESYYSSKLDDSFKKKAITDTIANLKSQGREKDIQVAIEEIKKSIINEKFITGIDLDNYIFDSEIAFEFASKNRHTIADTIIKNMGFNVLDSFETHHNYIDTKNKVIRKGAVSANNGERFIMPINMRDGSFIAIGKGNSDWNNSAPHGAGRILARGEAHEVLDLDKYKADMKDVFSTCVNEFTLDESADAYKPLNNLIDNIYPTADIYEHIRPIYNFKAN